MRAHKVCQVCRNIGEGRVGGAYVSEMCLLAENGTTEFTNTLLRDKFGLDKESGRDRIKRVMKVLEKDSKIVVAVKEGKKRQFVYKLVS